MRGLSLLALAFFSWPLAARTLPGSVIHGVVVFENGDPVSGAAVSISAAGRTVTATTTSSGGFTMTVPSQRRLVFVISRNGYSLERAVENFNSDDPITLRIPHFGEAITVTATRSTTRLADTAASVSIVSRQDIDNSASVTTDALLRSVPGFSLFRRTDSRVAHPTTQGVSLRGVGASGAGRALVLEDGVPLNDPFGGWVYWGRIPRSAIDRIEVLRGGASDLYGSSALGGVIQLVRRHPQQAAVDAELSAGSQQTYTGSFFASTPLRAFIAEVSAERFSTDGYFLIPEDSRGAVDRPAASVHTAADVTVTRPFDAGEAFARFSFYRESRENGTALQLNDSTIRQFTAGGDWSRGTSSITLRSFVENEQFNSTFTAVSAQRDSERLTRLQSVPADSWGAGGQWSTALGANNLFLSGVDVRDVSGTSDETVFAGTRSVPAIGGGSQRALGIFAEDSVQFGSRLSVTAGGRLDSWKNSDAVIVTGTGERHPPARDESAFSPRLSFLYRLGDGVSLAAAAYKSFRSPTLNELYRGFRVGNVDTLPNEDLRSERSKGAEAGLNLDRKNGVLTARGRLFWTEVEDTVANITLNSTPSLITRQRMNLGRSVSRGLELDVDFHPAPRWSLSSGYLFTDATVRDFPGNQALVGLRLPQTPEHQWTGGIQYAGTSDRVGLAVRYSASQFDDDENQFPLDSFFVVDLFDSHRLSASIDLIAAAENLFDRRYEVGRTPLLTVGPPRLVRVGIRWRMRD